MSSLRAPGLGPIVGHTTAHSCRIWARAYDPEDEGARLADARRTLGVAAVVREGGRKLRAPPAYYFRLHRERDRTGTLHIGEETGCGPGSQVRRLQPETDYEVRVGTLAFDDSFDNDEVVDDATLSRRLPRAGVWLDALQSLPPERSLAKFRTFSGNAAARRPLRFLIGSCRYPGLLWMTKDADRIFGPMADLVTAGDGVPPHMVLMVGDQIYADMLNRHVPIGLADTYEEFQSRYHNAFGSRNMRRLLRHVPTYMTLDDHEIEDNWSRDRLEQADKRRLFNLAINAYMAYQWLHGPRNYDGRLYSSFECGGYPVFVLDTRTQRMRGSLEHDGLDENYLLGRPTVGDEEPSQQERLTDWLTAQQQAVGDAPKFVVTSSVFAPNPVGARQRSSDSQRFNSDSWPAFPKTRDAILRCMTEECIQNVVFLSGDIHCANVAKLTFSSQASDLRAYSITSSALYWPFPFADGEPSGFVHDSRAEGDTFKISNDIEMDYVAWNFTQKNNFCDVTVDRENARIEVRVLDESGQLITESRRDGTRYELTTALDLAPW